VSRVGKWLALIFVVLPIAEIWILLVIGRQIGFLPTIAFLVGVGIVGSWLAKAEGARVLREIGRARQEGKVPEEGLLSAALILVAGLLLVIPGVITDLVGVVLLFPPTRRLVARAARRWFEARVARSGFQVQVGNFSGDEIMDRPIDQDEDVIDVEPEETRREPPALPKGPNERN
jgi:UPF0716 protein FxsA